MMTRALFVLSGILSAIWLWLVFAPITPPPSAPSTKADPAPRSEIPLFSQTVLSHPDRPLFRPTPPVRPTAAKASLVPPPPVAPPPEKKIRLVGVLEDQRERVAFLQVEGERDARRITTGQLVEGWRITAIALRSIELKRGGLRNVLYLDPPKTP